MIKAQNRTTFKITFEYYRELLTPKAILLLGSVKRWLNKKKMVKTCKN